MDKNKEKFDFKKLSQKWTKYWQEEGIYQPDLKSAKKPFYNLMMFPYPSAEGLHVGNMYAFTGADVYGRFKRMQGNDVFEPIGLDGFGIHSENYALKIGTNPMDQSKISEKRFYDQLHMIGNSYDWRHTVETYKPEYYKWTQWVFTTFFKAGLVVKKKSPVNWCPKDKTVLADEQVIGGLCERCGSVVETRELEQWFFRITQYAEKLLEGLNRIDWTEKVKLAQKNWIGKSEGAKVWFKIERLGEKLEVFTTRPDTLYGATFMVISPAHPILSKFDLSSEAQKYIKTANLEKAKQEDESKDKTGVFSGKYAINPVNGEKIPIWIADYVLMGYGTGAIMAVPAHDERDFQFAKKYNLPIKQVVSGPESKDEAYEGMGELKNSGDWDGIKVPQDISKVISDLEEKSLGKKETNYHLRDWLISRQRYWGAPIPMVFCEKCFEAKKSYFNTHSGQALENVKLADEMYGWFPVEDSNLPVKLPYIENFKPLGTGEAPLASDPDFVKTTCLNCGDEARRETDVCDTFLDSSWYFLRYPSTDFEDIAFDPQITKNWLPVNIYIGGAEHSVLHLLYSRFVGHVLHDLNFTAFDEPFPKFRAHGLIIKEGSKMSKSKGNVVNPDEYVEKFGADAIRLYLMFLGPFQQGGDFRDSGMEGMGKFVKRILRFANYQLEGESDTFLTDENLDILMNKTIKYVSQDIESLSYNTAIARVMEYLNALTKAGTKAKLERKYIKTLILLLAPFAPFITEELFHSIEPEAKSVHLASWPSFDEEKTMDAVITIAIQVNGKLRDTLSVGLDQSANESEIIKMAMESQRIKAHTQGKDIKKKIYVPGKVLNIVI